MRTITVRQHYGLTHDAHPKANTLRRRSGKKVIFEDDDFWADHDERVHGRIEKLKNDATYAAGFTWSCCGRISDASGCATRKHQV